VVVASDLGTMTMDLGERGREGGTTLYLVKEPS
jgi:hypothetical protein